MLASFRDLTAGISLHHNLLASSREHHPTLGGSPHTKGNVIVDFRNNVIYNVNGATNLGNCHINVINNYYLPGPDTPPDRRPIATKTENAGTLKVYMSGNVFVDHPDFTKDNYLAIDVNRWSQESYLPVTLNQIVSQREFDMNMPRPKTDDAQAGYEKCSKAPGLHCIEIRPTRDWCKECSIEPIT